MKSSTACNHAQRFRMRISDIFSTACVCRQSHAQILESLKRDVYDTPEIKRCPSWVMRDCRKQAETLFESLYHSNLIWAFETPDGPRIWEQLTDEQRQSYCVAGKSGDHYWLKPEHSHGKTSTVKGREVTRKYTITDDKF